MFVFILRVKSAEVNEQDSDSENEDHEGDMSLPFTKKAGPPPPREILNFSLSEMRFAAFSGPFGNFFSS